jgi:hypothetical protein
MRPESRNNPLLNNGSLTQVSVNNKPENEIGNGSINTA